MTKANPCPPTNWSPIDSAADDFNQVERSKNEFITGAPGDYVTTFWDLSNGGTIWDNEGRPTRWDVTNLSAWAPECHR